MFQLESTFGVARGTGGVNQRVKCKRVVGHFEHVGLAACSDEFSPCVNGDTFGWKFIGGFVAQQQDAAWAIRSLPLACQPTCSTPVSATARSAGVESLRM